MTMVWSCQATVICRSINTGRGGENPCTRPPRFPREETMQPVCRDCMESHPPRAQTVAVDINERQMCAFCGKPDALITWVDVDAAFVPFPYHPKMT